VSAQATSAGQREAENAIRFLREQVDAIDLQLIALLVQRARLAVRIGEVKEYANLPVVEMGREQKVLDRIERLRSEPLDEQGAKEIFTSIMLAMRRLQAKGRADLAEETLPAIRKKTTGKKKRA
jgi:chorismate mutase / prephenate dehydratase